MDISKFGINDFDIQIQDYCSERKINIPDSYKSFLKKYNGGLTINTKFEINGIKSDIKAFYGLGDVKYSLNKVDIIEDDKTKYIPVACDSFGNMIVLSLLDDTIYFANHEKSNSVISLNCNLKEFINKCISGGIKPESLKSVEEREADLIARGRGGIITEQLRDLWREEIEKYSSIELEHVDF